MSPGKEDQPPQSGLWLKQQQASSPSIPSSTALHQLAAMSTTATTTPSILRKSPRKQLSSSLPPLSRPGFSKLTITGNSILPADGSTPSPSSLVRTPSFTMLEPASYAASQLSAQTTDTFQGRTPLLRASLTSTCSSAALPGPTAAAAAAASKQQQLVRSGGGTVANVPRSTPTPCACAGRPRVCGNCLDLPHMHAARAGTPGFRPPEVLLKHAGQTAAIDLWAVGVMLLCILSRSYPFFRAPDDLTALAELTVLFGTKNVKEAAKRYGRRLATSQETEPKNLGMLCRCVTL